MIIKNQKISIYTVSRFIEMFYSCHTVNIDKIDSTMHVSFVSNDYSHKNELTMFF